MVLLATAALWCGVVHTSDHSQACLEIVRNVSQVAYGAYTPLNAQDAMDSVSLLRKCAGLIRVIFPEDPEFFPPVSEIFQKQDYNGTSYGKTYYSGNNQAIITLDCTEAMKHK